MTVLSGLDIRMPQFSQSLKATRLLVLVAFYNIILDT